MRIAPLMALWEKRRSPRRTKASWVFSSNMDSNCSFFFSTLWISAARTETFVSFCDANLLIFSLNRLIQICCVTPTCATSASPSSNDLTTDSYFAQKLNPDSSRPGVRSSHLFGIIIAWEIGSIPVSIFLSVCTSEPNRIAMVQPHSSWDDLQSPHSQKLGCSAPYYILLVVP